MSIRTYGHMGYTLQREKSQIIIGKNIGWTLAVSCGQIRPLLYFVRPRGTNIWKSAPPDIIFALQQRFNEEQLGPFNTKLHPVLCWMPNLDTPATSSSDLFSLEKKLELAVTTAET